MPLRLALLAGLVLAAAPLVLADGSASFSDSSSDCRMLVHPPFAGQGLDEPSPIGCSVTHWGTLTVTAAECSTSYCMATLDAHARATSEGPWFHHLSMFADPFGDPLCGTIDVPVAPIHDCDVLRDIPIQMPIGACKEFHVTSLYHGFTTPTPFFEAVGFQLYITQSFDACRDADGTPHVTLA
jgi:hypothetical protein